LKERLDKILVAKGLVKSRELARALIMEGNVFVDGSQVTKAGSLVHDTADIDLRKTGMPYVSRGGLKIEAAIDFFHITAQDKIIMDVGASTGGFTDCLLQRGARKIYCIDVGYGQLAWSLRKDPRVVLLERTNIRYLSEKLKERGEKGREQGMEELIESRVNMAVADVSFISLKTVIPAVVPFLHADAEILALVKPQFEVGKGEVGKGGIVKEEEKRLSAVEDVRGALERLGLTTIGVFQSPTPGQKGNREYFLYMKREYHG
jgi:23S rRNA (cytidine1920-2'-O)/16S rRNA (cytidine1409-2'-O)-methyltransferase